MDTPSTTPRRRFLPTIVAIGLLALGLCAVWYWHTYRFDQSVWKASRNLQPDTLEYPRSKMVRDLLWRHVKVGMARSELRETLGEPDMAGEKVDSYWIGFYGWMAIDPSLLKLQYDQNGKLNRINIHET